MKANRQLSDTELTAWSFIGMIAMLAAFALLFSGCFSVTLVRVGGRDQICNFHESNDSAAVFAMDAPSSASGEVTDLIHDNMMPLGEVEVSDSETPDAPTPVEPDTSEIPNPSGSLLMPSGFLWKPVSENDGKLVVLTPAELEVHTLGITEANSTYTTISPKVNRANGDRQHFRTIRPGSDYVGPVLVEAFTSDNIYSIIVPEPGARHENK